MTKIFNQILNDMQSTDWRNLTLSQLGSTYFQSGHALDNQKLRKDLTNFLSKANIDLKDKTITTDYRQSSVMTANLVPSIFTELDEFVITNKQADQLNVLPVPKHIVFVENDNLLYTLKQLTNLPIIAGNGYGIVSYVHKHLIQWALSNHVTIHYLGDLDPIGLAIAQKFKDLLPPDYEPFDLYPGYMPMIHLLQRKGQLNQTISSKRFNKSNFKLIQDKTLLNIKDALLFEDNEKHLEQEQLIDEYLTKLNLLN